MFLKLSLIQLSVSQTGKTLYILANQQAKDGTIAINVERRVTIGSIKSIAMSNLQDDWMVRYLSRPSWSRTHVHCS